MYLVFCFLQLKFNIYLFASSILFLLATYFAQNSDGKTYQGLLVTSIHTNKKAHSQQLHSHCPYVQSDQIYFDTSATFNKTQTTYTQPQNNAAIAIQSTTLGGKQIRWTQLDADLEFNSDANLDTIRCGTIKCRDILTADNYMEHN